MQCMRMKVIIIFLVMIIAGVVIDFDRVSCIGRGGSYTVDGSSTEVCFEKAKDGGKYCTDSNQCDSELCTAPLNAATTTTSGECYRYLPFSGCWNQLQDGKLSGVVCN